MEAGMLVSDVGGFGDPEAAGGLLSNMHWGDLGAAVAFFSGSLGSAVWNWGAAPLGNALWEVWGEMRGFLGSIPPALAAGAAGASEVTLLLLLMLSLFSLGPDLGF